MSWANVPLRVLDHTIISLQLLPLPRLNMVSTYKYSTCLYSPNLRHSCLVLLHHNFSCSLAKIQPDLVDCILYFPRNKAVHKVKYLLHFIPSPHLKKISEWDFLKLSSLLNPTFVLLLRSLTLGKYHQYSPYKKTQNTMLQNMLQKLCVWGLCYTLQSSFKSIILFYLYYNSAR